MLTTISAFSDKVPAPVFSKSASPGSSCDWTRTSHPGSFQIVDTSDVFNQFTMSSMESNCFNKPPVAGSTGNRWNRALLTPYECCARTCSEMPCVKGATRQRCNSVAGTVTLASMMSSASLDAKPEVAHRNAQPEIALSVRVSLLSHVV